jgi:hypothetical protein
MQHAEAAEHPLGHGDTGETGDSAANGEGNGDPGGSHSCFAFGISSIALPYDGDAWRAGASARDGSNLRGRRSRKRVFADYAATFGGRDCLRNSRPTGLSIADRNLQAARRRRLNAAQADLVSKIRGFLKDAHEAAKVADWARARSLSKKAQVLSEELVTSL